MARKNCTGNIECKPPPETEVVEAVEILTLSYRERAGEEALFRAFLAEREFNRRQARFWVRVYERVSRD